MELAFSIDRDGLVEDTHAVVYKQLGAWVRACYGSPLATSSGAGHEFVLHLRKGDIFDRFQLVEDIVTGQRIRNYTIAINPSLDSRAGGATKTILVNGDAIGQKRIHLLYVTHWVELPRPQFPMPHVASFCAACAYECVPGSGWLMTLRLGLYVVR